MVVDTLYTPDLRETFSMLPRILYSSHCTGIFLRHGVEAQSVFVTFAATFLIKVCVCITNFGAKC